MPTQSNNHPREDAIFQTKVKHALLLHGGTGGLVPALLDFLQLHQTAVQNGQEGMNYDTFLRYLQKRGAELSAFEADYLCRAFDDTKSGCISPSTFIRHLTGLNYRRMKIVEQAWASLQKDERNEVSREALLSLHDDIATSRGMVMNTSDAMRSTLHSVDRSGLKDSLAGSVMAAGRGCSGEVSGGDKVSEAEFVAFYAGVSQQMSSDEAFQRHVLQAWAADKADAPMLHETARDWGPDGDSLAIEGTHLVQDALNVNLGISSKSYNYTHMQRTHPYVEPLPPLSREEIMNTTTQLAYRPYTREEYERADPLATRRGPPQGSHAQHV